jgi:hypothetical protein
MEKIRINKSKKQAKRRTVGKMVIPWSLCRVYLFVEKASNSQNLIQRKTQSIQKEVELDSH